jgi:hypothetical protein
VVVARLSAPFRPSWARWAAAAAVLLLAVGWWALRPATPAAVLISQDGRPPEGVVVTRAGRAVPPAKSRLIAPGDTIEVAPDSPPAKLGFDAARTTLVLQPGSTLRILSLVPQKHFTLDRGALKAEVAPQPAGRPMLVQTPFADAVVVGTAFSLSARANQTGLTVEHGVVKLTQADGSVENVKAGQSAVATLGSPITFVGTPAGVKPVPMRTLQAWVKGPLEWPASGALALFPGTMREHWALLPGVTWNANGLRLACTDEPKVYRAVSPSIPVRPGERLVVRGRALVEQGARLRLKYYERDEAGLCFGFNTVPGDFTAPEAGESAPFEFAFTTIDSPELKTIALIFYCYHADQGPPQAGDAIDVQELSIERR